MHKIPKVELHIHIDGSCRNETLLELLKKKNKPLPGDGSLEAFAKACVIIPNENSSLDGFLHSFSNFYPALIGDLEAIERISYELVEDQAKNGVVYFEGRFSPHLLSTTHGHFDKSCSEDDPKAITPAMVVESHLKGLKNGERDFNVKARAILCCVRGQPGWSSDVVELCAKYRDDGVVGMDIACNEGDGVVEGFNLASGELVLAEEDIAAYKRAYELGIHRTAHACEVGPPEVARAVINQLHVERIGHGYHILKDDSTYQMVQDLDIHIECCPQSSMCTGCMKQHSKHPIIKFAEDKVNFSISSDDPVVTGTRITDDFMLAKSFGLTDEDLKRVTFNAAKSAFLPEDEKKELIEKLEALYNAIES